MNATMMSGTLSIISLGEVVVRAFWLRKKTMNLCGCDSEDREHGVVAEEFYNVVRNTNNHTM